MLHRSRAIVGPLAALLAFSAGGPTVAPSVRADDQQPKQDNPATVESLREAVADLVAMLGSPRRTERRDGEQRLLELGPKALAHLPPTSQLESAAEREAVRRIRRELELRAAKDSIRASRVTFAGRVTLRDFLDEVTRRTGNEFDVQGLGEERLSTSQTVDVRSEPFWNVVDEYLPSFGVRFDDQAESEAVTLVDGAASDATVSYFESFRIKMLPLRRRPLYGDDDHDLLRASVVVHAEPRLRPLFARYRGDSLRVQTSAATALAPLSPTATLETPVSGRRIAPRWDVRVPSGDTPRTASVRGAIVLTVAAGEEVIRFPTFDQTRNVSRRRGGVVVRTQSAELGEPNDEGRGAIVRTTVSYDDGGPAFESHRTWVFYNDAKLEDARGREIAPDGPPTVQLSEDGTVAVTYTFGGLRGTAADYRFVYVAPTLVVDVPIPFARDDVPVESLPGPGRE